MISASFMFDGCRLLVISQGIEVDEVAVGLDMVVVLEVHIMEGGMAMLEGVGGVPCLIGLYRQFAFS